MLLRLGKHSSLVVAAVVKRRQRHYWVTSHQQVLVVVDVGVALVQQPREEVALGLVLEMPDFPRQHYLVNRHYYYYLLLSASFVLKKRNDTIPVAEHTFEDLPDSLLISWPRFCRLFEKSLAVENVLSELAAHPLDHSKKHHVLSFLAPPLFHFLLLEGDYYYYWHSYSYYYGKRRS